MESHHTPPPFRARVEISDFAIVGSSAFANHWFRDSIYPLWNFDNLANQD
jgi:hypothetical protein